MLFPLDAWSQVSGMIGPSCIGRSVTGGSPMSNFGPLFEAFDVPGPLPVALTVPPVLSVVSPVSGLVVAFVGSVVSVVSVVAVVVPALAVSRTSSPHPAAVKMQKKPSQGRRCMIKLPIKPDDTTRPCGTRACKRRDFSHVHTQRTRASSRLRSPQRV